MITEVLETFLVRTDDEEMPKSIMAKLSDGLSNGIQFSDIGRFFLHTRGQLLRKEGDRVPMKA